MDKVNSRHVYKGPNERWMWWHNEYARWTVGDKEDIGTSISFMGVRSPAPTPELIANKTWEVAVNDEWEDAEITVTAIKPKPIPGVCAPCLHCRLWRRCGRCTGCCTALYCSKECQLAHWQTKHQFECEL